MTTEKWHNKSVGSFLNLLSGFPFPSSKFSTLEGFPLIRIRDVVGSKIETYYQGAILPQFIIRNGDVLIGMDGDFNVSRWKNRDALLNQRVLKVSVSNPNELDLHFVFYWLQPFVAKINDITPATTVKHLSVTDIKKAWAVVPDVTRQGKIGKVLGTIDQAIEKTEALIEKYQQIKAGLMHDLFTRGIGPDGKLRPPREQAPELYQETPFGWIPKEWECSSLATKSRFGISHIRTGPFGSALKGEHWVEEGVPVITIGALGEGKFQESELLFISEAYVQRLSDFRMKVGDVVFSRVADVGRSVTVKEDQDGWVMSSNLMRISLDQSLVVPDFLQFQLAFDQRVKKQIRCRVNSGGRDVANGEILNSLFFVWPSFAEQEEILQRAKTVSARIEGEKQEVDKLAKRKLGLMHDLLTGKVPVNPDPHQPADV